MTIIIIHHGERYSSPNPGQLEDRAKEEKLITRLMELVGQRNEVRHSLRFWLRIIPETLLMHHLTIFYYSNHLIVFETVGTILMK